MRRVGLIAALALLPPLVLAGLLYKGTSTGPLTPWLEKRLGAVLQRPVSFTSPPAVRLRGSLDLEIEGLTVSGLTPEEAPLLYLGQGTLTVTTASLWAPIPVIEALKVRELRVAVRIDGAGNSNIPDLGGKEDDAEAAPWDSLPIDLKKASFQEIHFTRADERDGKTLEFFAQSIAQRVDGDKLMTVEGDGTLQGRPWHFSAKLSSPEPLLALRKLRLSLEGAVDELSLEGELQLPSPANLAEAELRAGIHGSLPREITELSPLLAPDIPIDIDLAARDALPGLDLELSVALPRVNASARGHVADPRNLDGLDLAVEISAPDANAVLLTLGLPELESMPLEATASVERQGTAVSVTALRAQVGSHELRGSGSAPDFPSPDDARLDLDLSGPDFSLLQQLALIPVTLDKPYRAVITLAQRDGPELLDSTLTVGDHALTVSGPLGGLPTLAGSDLRWNLAGPTLLPLLASLGLGLDLPDTPYSGNGRLRVVDDGSLSLNEVLLEAYDVDASLAGSARAFPDFRDLSATLQLKAESLAELTPRFDLKPLGDLPATASLSVSGDLNELEVRDIALTAGGLSVVQRSGALRASGSAIDSDLLLEVTLQELGPLLGEYGWEGVTENAIRFDLAPHLEQDRWQVEISDLVGTGLTGRASIDVASDFSLDARTRLDATLRIAKPTTFIPPVAGLTFADQPLSITSSLRRQNDRGHIDLEVEAGTVGTLNGTLDLPQENQGAAKLALEASSADLHQLVTHDVLPDLELPLSLALQAIIESDSTDLRIDRLSLAESQLQGSVRIAHDGSALSGALEVPQAELQAWLDRGSTEGDAADSEESKATAREDGRLIPDLLLPLETLGVRDIDLRIDTGDLGLADPYAPDASLVETLAFTLTANAQQFQLSLDNLSGSRGSWQGELRLGLPGEAPEHYLTLTAREVPAAIISRARDLKSAPKNDLDASFSARGSRLRAVTGSLEGELLMTGGPGTLRSTAMRFATDSFLQQLITTLLPVMKQSTDLEVQCTALALQARAGVIKLNPGFVTRSKRVELSARGEVDLVRERLRVRFDNQARQGLGISAASLVNPYVQITGKLSNPRLGLDVTSSAIAGSAAVATGGLSVLAKPLLGRFLKLGNPCKKLVKEWEARDKL